MVRSDLDTLLMPLLRQLYNATRRAPSHMYMLLVIVLILSQDAAFAAAVHKVTAPPSTAHHVAVKTACAACNELSRSRLGFLSAMPGNGLLNSVQHSGRLIADIDAQVTVSSVPWYKERLLQKVSLGSLLMIVLLRTAHYNLAKLKVRGCRARVFEQCI